MQARPRKLKRSVIFLLLCAAFGTLAVYGGWNLLHLQKESADADRTYQQIYEQIPTGTAVPDPYQTLYEQYPDMIGWISIADTKVNYPVMQTKSNPNYYLHNDINGSYSRYGVPYLQENCDPNTSTNLIIYSHAMKDGSMFGSLLSYTDSSYWKSHPEISLTIGEEVRTYQIFAVYVVDIDGQDVFQYWNEVEDTGSAYDAYVSQIKSLALYDTGITPTGDTQLLSLSTCEYTHENGRLVVVGQRIS